MNLFEMDNERDLDLSSPTMGQLIRSYPARLCLYGVLTAILYQLIFLGVKDHGAALMGAENGPLELAQVAFALIAAIGLFYGATQIRVGRVGLIISGAAVTYAAARESDLLFEDLFFDDAYKYFVGLPMCLLVAGAIAVDRKRIRGDVFWLMKQPAATLFVVAGIFLCGVCQTLDRPDLWGNLRYSTDAVVTKAMIEEYAELFAYLLLAFSGIEAAILSRQVRRQVATQSHSPAKEAVESTPERARIAA